MQNLTVVYGAVIDDVLSKVRSEFVQEGNEPVLDELRSLWEEKLLQTGVLDANTAEEEAVKEQPRALESGFVQAASAPSHPKPVSAAPTVQVAGQPYQQPAHIYVTGQQYLQQNQHLQQPSRSPAVPQGPVFNHTQQTHLPNQAYGQSSNAYRTAHTYLGQQQLAGQYSAGQHAYGQIQPQSQHYPSGNSADGRKRKVEELQVPYGAESAQPHLKQERLMGVSQTQRQLPQAARSLAPTADAIPQQDGPGDELPAPAEGPPAEGSLDNLSDVEVDDNAIEAKMLPDFILGQYENVKRIKNRWRCNFNHVVMHLNGQDIVVSKATGEFTF